MSGGMLAEPERQTSAAPNLEMVRALKGTILLFAKRRRLSDVRVFGSVARGQASPRSDVDLLVHPDPDASVFDLAGFMADVADVLGASCTVR